MGIGKSAGKNEKSRRRPAAVTVRREETIRKALEGRSGSRQVMVSRGGFRSLVIGLDGSTHSRRAVAFVSRLKVPAGGRATLVRVVEPVRPPSMGLLPGAIRGRLAGQAAALEATQLRAARRELEAAAQRLRKSGWRVREQVRSGVPLAELLQAVKASRADLLVLGARGVGGVTRLLLGSVADAVSRRAPVSVLIVR